MANEKTRVDEFLAKFNWAFDMAFDTLGKDLSVVYSIYVRDMSDRSEDFPDWRTGMINWFRGMPYDKATFKQLTEDYLSNMNS